MAAATKRTKRSKGESKTEEEKAPSLEEQLDKAEIAVKRSRDATAHLHKQWREHMLRLSLLVIVLAFSQCRQPMNKCISNIKLANSLSNDQDGILISGYQASLYILHDSTCEIFGLLLLFSLTAFLSMTLSETGTAFSSPFYMIATALLPLQLALFYQQKGMGCLHVLPSMPEEVEMHNFPVPVIYHAIVTASFFFMEYQMKQRNNDVQRVEEMRQHLKRAQGSNKKRK